MNVDVNDVVTGGYWAEAVCNNDFICIDTYSGYGSGERRDPKGVQHLLPVDVSDGELGAALLDAMAHSRFVLPRKYDDDPPEITYDPELYNYELTSQRYKDWVKSLMDIYGYKTKKKLFTGMKNCSVGSKNNLITIRPSHHEKLEAWSGANLTEADNVIIPANSSAVELGAALRLAFSHCT